MMHGAGFQGRSEILKLLLADSRKINPSDRHADGYTPIHRACWGRESRHTETIKTFIEVGKVSHEEPTSDGRTCAEMTQNKGTQMYLKNYEEEMAREEL